MTTSPDSNHMALSDRRLMALGQWEETTMAMPLFFTDSTRARCTMSAVLGSSVPVGSSARNIKGSLANWRARTQRCFSPPERSRAMCMVRCSRPTALSKARAFSTLCFSFIGPKASKMFSMTLDSPKRAKVRCNMMAMRSRMAMLKGSLSFKPQKSTSCREVLPPHFLQGSPFLGISTRLHFSQ